MTKEERANDLLHAAKGLSIHASKIRLVVEHMDEYAKEVAIGFKKWADSFYIESGQDLALNVYYSHVSRESEENFTIEQLFNLYLQSLNQ